MMQFPGQYQEELRKLKEVLDMGFILQEEFEFRKKVMRSCFDCDARPFSSCLQSYHITFIILIHVEELEEKYNISGSGESTARYHVTRQIRIISVFSYFLFFFLK